MKKKINKREIDVEAKIFMALLHLKEEKNKNYSIEECEKNIVYLFNNYDEFKSYFELNGFADIDKVLLDLCRIKITKKGTIIALKKLCDHAIRKHNSTYSHNINFSSDKMEAFLNFNPNSEIRCQQEEVAKVLKVNNLVEEVPILKKARKSNR